MNEKTREEWLDEIWENARDLANFLEEEKEVGLMTWWMFLKNKLKFFAEVYQEGVAFSFEEIVLIQKVFGSHSQASISACGLEGKEEEILNLYNKITSNTGMETTGYRSPVSEREYDIFPKSYIEKTNNLIKAGKNWKKHKYQHGGKYYTSAPAEQKAKQRATRELEEAIEEFGE